MNEKICVSCGQNLPESVKFCEICGTPVPKDLHNSTGAPTENPTMCHACGTASPPGSKFCEKCGTPVPKDLHNSTGAPTENPTICHACGTASPPGSKFCAGCGHPTADTGPTEQPAYTAANMQRPVNAANAPISKGVRFFRKNPLASVIAIVLVIALLITGFWQPGFFLNGAGASDGPFHSGNSAAFSFSPFDGFTISADANALDQDRDFDVSEASEEVFIDVSDTMSENGVLLLNLYELDAGLNDDERFPGVFDMTFDLEELEIPEALYDYTTVYRISDDGEATELVCTVRNGKLLCQSDKNCLVAIGSALYWGGGIAIAFCGGFFGYKATSEYTEKWAGLSGKTLMHVDICDGLYRVTWAIDDNTEWRVKKNRLNVIYKRIIKDLDKEINEAGTLSAFGMRQYYNSFLASMIAQDQEYQTLLKEFKGLTETLTSSTPYQVSQVINALIKANDYLSQTKGFTARTNKTDVILVYDWPAGDTAFGYANNPYAASPYMLINMSGFPINGAAGDASVMGDMYLTITHELFHIFQTNYTTIDWNSNLIFWEATAVAVETDAFNDYTRDGTITTTPDLTETKFLETLSTSLGKMPAGGEGVAQLNGYTLSRFIQYVQNNGGNFKLKELMNAFTSKGDFSAALQSAAGMDDEKFAAMYKNFCRTNTQEFFNRYKAAASGSGISNTLIAPVELSAGTLYAKVPVADTPLSAYFREFKVNTSSIAGGQYALLLASDESLMTKLNYATVNITAGVVPTPKGLFYPVSSAASAYLFEIHSYTQPDGINAFYKAYILTPPENPTVTLNEGKTMTIQLPSASKAALDGQIDGYLVTITASDGVVTNKHVLVSKWGDPLSLKLKKLTAETENVSFTVTVKEYIKSGSDYHYGPISNNGGSYLSEQVLDEQLLDAQAGTGEITVSMLWSTADDLDLHIITPSGAEIYYSNKTADGGTLDVDRNASSDSIVASPIENIYFQSPQPGMYKVFIYNYYDRTESGSSNYIVRVTVGGQSQTYTGTIGDTGSTVDIIQINYGS